MRFFVTWVLWKKWIKSNIFRPLFFLPVSCQLWNNLISRASPIFRWYLRRKLEKGPIFKTQLVASNFMKFWGSYVHLRMAGPFRTRTDNFDLLNSKCRTTFGNAGAPLDSWQYFSKLVWMISLSIVFSILYGFSYKEDADWFLDRLNLRVSQTKPSLVSTKNIEYTCWGYYSFLVCSSYIKY